MVLPITFIKEGDYMNQSMFRVSKDKDNPYVILNKEFLNDINLSLKAKGLLAYLLSLPDDWKIYENELVQHHKDGRESMKSAIKELMENCYINREQLRDSSGRLNGYEYRVYETSYHNVKPVNGKSDNGKPVATI